SYKTKITKHESTTMGIKHRADRGLRKISALIQLGFRRTVKSFEMPYVSYSRTLCVSVKIHRSLKHVWLLLTRKANAETPIDLALHTSQNKIIRIKLYKSKILL